MARKGIKKQRNKALKRTAKRERKAIKKIEEVVERKKENPKKKSGFRSFLGKAAEYAGTGIGAYFGAPGLGKQAGSMLGKWITGSGDYVTNFEGTNKNSLMSAGPPVFEGSGRGVRIKKREFLGLVKNGAVSSGETVFTNDVHYLNPGLAATFPWLSGVAHQFEQYKMHGCVFEFVSTYANAVSSTNGAIGSVVMATNYNVLEADFQNLTEALNYEMSEVGKPTQSFLHAIECKPSEEPLKCMFVRDGNVADKEDLRFSDIGKFQIMSQGQQAQTSLGELWVSYDVELMKPRVPTAGLSQALAYYAYNDTGISNTDPIGTLSSLVVAGDLSITATKSGSDVVFTFPKWVGSGYFSVQIGYSSGSAALTLPGINPTTGCSFQNLYDNFTTHFAAAGSGLTTTSMINDVVFKITDNAPSFTVTGAALVTGASPKVNVVVTDLSGLIFLQSKEAKRQETLKRMIREIIEEEKYDFPLLPPLRPKRPVDPSMESYELDEDDRISVTKERVVYAPTLRKR